jgi:hypothetical protein
MNHVGVEILRLGLNKIIFVAFDIVGREVANQITDKILVSFASNEQGFCFTFNMYYDVVYTGK